MEELEKLLVPEPDSSNVQLGNNTKLEYKPTLKQRIIRRLGFGYPGRPDMEDLEDAPNLAPGYLTQTVEIHFNWRDRLRLLISGIAVVEISTKTDKPIDVAIARSKVGVIWRFLRG